MRDEGWTALQRLVPTAVGVTGPLSRERAMGASPSEKGRCRQTLKVGKQLDDSDFKWQVVARCSCTTDLLPTWYSSRCDP